MTPDPQPYDGDAAGCLVATIGIGLVFACIAFAGVAQFFWSAL